MSVLVYVLNPTGDVNETSRLFQNRLFTFETINLNEKQNWNNGGHFSPHQHRNASHYAVLLERSASTSPAAHVIIIRQNMICNFTHERLAMLISSLTAHSETDVFYLSKSLDRCDLYDHQDRIRHQGKDLGHLSARTYQPNGIQALMFSPAGRDKILDAWNSSKHEQVDFNQFLQNLVRQQQLNAEAIVPNVFHYDISRAQNANDLMLLNECMPPPSSTSSSSMSVLIFIAIIFIVLLISFIALWLGRVKLN